MRKHLSEFYQDANDGKLDSWKAAGEGEGATALVLLLDQVPRNIFRDTQGSADISEIVYRAWVSMSPTLSEGFMIKSNERADLHIAIAYNKDHRTVVYLVITLLEPLQIGKALFFRDHNHSRIP